MSQIDALAIGENTFPFHSFDEMGPHLEAALGDDVATTLTIDRDDLVDLSEYDVVVDYLTDSTLTDDQREGLLSFVADGGGYLGVHCASDLTSVADDDDELGHVDEPFPELRELIGGHFLSHPERSTFGVDVVDDDHPVTVDVSDFEVYDEPYQVDYDADRVQVLARMDHPDLEDYPVVWVREHGEGRVCYSSLGHTPEAFEQPDHRRLLRNGARWVANA